MESDSLLHRDGDTAPSKNDRTKSQNLSTWALVVAVTLLTVVLIADVRLRGAVFDFRRTHGAATTDTSHDAAVSSPSTTTTSSSSTPRFQATQFVSFTINTLGGLAEYGECKGRNVDPKSNSCYLGSDDIETDVDHRLAIVEEVLYTLRYEDIIISLLSFQPCLLLFGSCECAGPLALI